MLKATVKELDKVRGMVRRGRLSGKKEIDARVRGILKNYRIGKHFDLDIREDGFKYKVNEDALIAEVTAKSKGHQELIEKRLKRSRGHIFLCMLAYYVQWHMMEAWRPLLYADEDQKAKDFRDPVAPAKRSDSAMKKARTKRLDDGSRVYSFRSLLGHLGAIVRAACHCSGKKDISNTFTMITRRNPKQQKAFDLLKTIRM